MINLFNKKKVDVTVENNSQETAYVAKSLQPDFTTLNPDEQAAILVEDAEKCIFETVKVDFNEYDSVGMNLIMYSLENNFELVDNVIKFINTMRKYGTADYKIVAKFLYSKILDKLEMSIIDFVKRFFLGVNPDSAQKTECEVTSVLKPEVVETNEVKVDKTVNASSNTNAGKQIFYTNKDIVEVNHANKKHEPEKVSADTKKQKTKSNKTEEKKEVKVDTQEKSGAGLNIDNSTKTDKPVIIEADYKEIKEEPKVEEKKEVNDPSDYFVETSNERTKRVMSKFNKDNKTEKQVSTSNGGKKDKVDKTIKVNTQENSGANKSMSPRDIVETINKKSKSYGNESASATVNNNSTPATNNIAKPETITAPQIPPVHPELNIEQKADLLRTRIKFDQTNRKEVTMDRIDSLIRLIEGPYLATNLAKFNAKDGILYEIPNFRFDKRYYDFAFYAETNIPNKVIVILYNSVPTFNNIGWVNNLNIYITEADKIKS